MITLGRGEEIIDVREPNRKLTDQEIKEDNVTSNVSIGIWDTEMLQDVFNDIDLKGLGLDVKELRLQTAGEFDHDVYEDDFDVDKEL